MYVVCWIPRCESTAQLLSLDVAEIPGSQESGLHTEQRSMSPIVRALPHEHLPCDVVADSESAAYGYMGYAGSAGHELVARMALL